MGARHSVSTREREPVPVPTPVPDSLLMVIEVEKFWKRLSTSAHRNIPPVNMNEQTNDEQSKEVNMSEYQTNEFPMKSVML